MKTTISGRPKNQKIEFPCLMNLKCTKDIVAMVYEKDSLFCYIACLSGTTNVSCSYELSKELLSNHWELFVGEITLSND